MSTSSLHRRDFIRAVAVTGGALAAGGLLAGCDTDPTHAHHPMPLEPSFARGGGAVIRNPLRIPQSVSPDGLTLRAAPGNVTVIPGKTTAAWMYNGQFPAPTLVANSGGRGRVTSPRRGTSRR